MQVIRQRLSSKRHTWIPSAIPFFLFGFIYYFVSPALVFRFLSERHPLLDAATRFFDPGYFDFRYFLDAAVILVSFLLGYVLTKAGTAGRGTVADYGSVQTSFPGILAISFGALIVFLAISARMAGATFFTGYSTYNILVLGPFSTCVFLSAWFVNYFSRREIRFFFLVIFGICSVLLLGWGSRMFFVLGFVALILGLVSRNRQLLRSPWFYGFLALCFVFMMAVGVARQGGREFSGDNLLAILFAEPLFTAVSGSLYLEHSGGRPMFGVPYDLFASVIHFIPSAIFPGKIALINQITFSEHIESPFGAKALIVSLYSNFGVFYPVFVVAVGAYYGFLRKKSRHSIFYRATYFSALPVLAFLFFRDNLTTVIKVLVFNGLAMPLFIAFLLVWLLPRRSAGKKVRHVRIGNNSLTSVQGSGA